jgi:hypothetical protein
MIRAPDNMLNVFLLLKLQRTYREPADIAGQALSRRWGLYEAADSYSLGSAINRVPRHPCGPNQGE